MKKIALIVGILAGTGFSEISKAEQACYDVQGMTCATCSLTLKSAVKRIKGVQTVKASAELKNAVVEFDPAQTSPPVLEKAINDVGYKATPQSCKKIDG